MGTYIYEKVVKDYETGEMSVEMALGHGLQHIGKLYEAQTNIKSQQQAMQKEALDLQEMVKALQNSLGVINRTLAGLKVRVDKLETQSLGTSKKEPLE